MFRPVFFLTFNAAISYEMACCALFQFDVIIFCYAAGSAAARLFVCFVIVCAHDDVFASILSRRWSYDYWQDCRGNDRIALVCDKDSADVRAVVCGQWWWCGSCVFERIFVQERPLHWYDIIHWKELVQNSHWRRILLKVTRIRGILCGHPSVIASFWTAQKCLSAPALTLS